MQIAVVVPCHNEEASIPHFVERMAAVEHDLAPWLSEPVSYVLVDDGSTDGTLSCMRELHTRDQHWHYVSFSRNFGKEAGLLAGMRKALELGSTHVAVMDADLQDPPELLVQMCERIEGSEFDAVAAYRETRKGEPPIRSWFAHKFYDFMNTVSETTMRDGARDFRLMTRRMVEEICSLPEVGRFSKGLFMWVGFKTDWLGYENVEREYGTTSWSFLGLVRYAIDGILAFSIWPLEAISVVGVALSVLSLLFLLFIFVRALLFGDPVAGWPSMICVVTLLGGMQILGIGTIGLYLSKVYSETKRRPSYIISEQG